MSSASAGMAFSFGLMGLSLLLVLALLPLLLLSLAVVSLLPLLPVLILPAPVGLGGIEDARIAPVLRSAGLDHLSFELVVGSLKALSYCGSAEAVGAGMTTFNQHWAIVAHDVRLTGIYWYG